MISQPNQSTMTPEIIQNTLAFLERSDMKGKEVPAFNAVVSALLSYKNELEMKQPIPQPAQ